MILFLDFDGVLHPDSVYMTSTGPMLRGDGRLFMWVDILETELAPHPEVRVVLSTSWVRHLDFSRAKKRLPKGLRERVVGSTWHSSMAKTWADQNWWDHSTRYAQIMRYVSRSKVTSWLALDDDFEGWSDCNRSQLVLTDGATGLSNEAVCAQLRAKLVETASFS